MCVVSFVGDHYNQKWNQPDYNNLLQKIKTVPDTVTKEEFDSLKKEVEEMKQLLIKAKLYDEKNNEPDCEMENKVKFLKEMAELMKVDLKEIFK